MKYEKNTTGKKKKGIKIWEVDATQLKNRKKGTKEIQTSKNWIKKSQLSASKLQNPKGNVFSCQTHGGEENWHHGDNGAHKFQGPSLNLG